MQQRDPAAKIGVWAYYLFTLASFTLIKSTADLIGPRRRVDNFTRMLTRWEDAFGKRAPALLLLTFMTLAVGFVKLAVPTIIIMVAQGS